MRFKNVLCATTVLTLSLGNLQNVFAYDMPQNVRIGLIAKYNNVPSVPIDNNDIFVEYGKGSDLDVEAELTSDTGFVVNVDNNYYVDSGINEDDINESSSNPPKVVGYKLIPSLISADTFDMYYGPFTSNDDATSFVNTYGGTVVKPNGEAIDITSGSDISLIMDISGKAPQIQASSDEFIDLGDRQYRGVVEFDRQSSGNITPVNVLPLEEYLYGVVPSEMPASWNLEALKAQAVAARTYTIYEMNSGVHKSDGYDLCDTVHCQNYLGAGNENPNSTEAVDETKGQIITYDGKPIEAVYFASDGGSTANSEDVWSTEVPYLRAVDDSFDNGQKAWSFKYSMSDLTNLADAYGFNIGDVKEFYISDVADGGNVKEVTIVGTNGTKTIKGDAIRGFFAGSSNGTLPSLYFTVTSADDGTVLQVSSGENSTNGNNYLDDTVSVVGADESSEISKDEMYVMGSDNKTDPADGLDISVIDENNAKIDDNSSSGTATSDYSDGIVISGTGNGHGVGMSQTGANGMANAGYTYDQILKHYYTGVDIE